MSEEEDKYAAASGAKVLQLLGDKDPDTSGVTEVLDLTVERGTSGAPAPAGGVTLRSIFHHPEAHPVILDLLLLRKYDADWLLWEPETLRLVIPRDFNTTLSEVNFHKLCAVKTLHLVDTFWQRWEVFLWCTMSLNGTLPDFEVLAPPTVAQLLVAVDVANQLRDDVSWSEEIKGFVKSVYKYENIFCPQPPADFIKLDTEGLIVDCEEVSKLWPAVKAANKAPQGDTVTDEQLRRLLQVHTYLEESRARLQHQLGLVKNAL
jgi:hypothetical protein